MHSLYAKNSAVTALMIAAYASVISATKEQFDAEVKRDRAFATFIDEAKDDTTGKPTYATVTAAKAAFELKHPNFHRVFEQATIALKLAELSLSSAKAERDGLSNDIEIAKLAAAAFALDSDIEAALHEELVRGECGLPK
jgi:hypothetical protein